MYTDKQREIGAASMAMEEVSEQKVLPTVSIIIPTKNRADDLEADDLRVFFNSVLCRSS